MIAQRASCRLRTGVVLSQEVPGSAGCSGSTVTRTHAASLPLQLHAHVRHTAFPGPARPSLGLQPPIADRVLSCLSACCPGFVSATVVLCQCSLLCCCPVADATLCLSWQAALRDQTRIISTLNTHHSLCSYRLRHGRVCSVCCHACHLLACWVLAIGQSMDGWHLAPLL